MLFQNISSFQVRCCLKNKKERLYLFPVISEKNQQQEYCDMTNHINLNGVWDLTYAEGNQISVFEEFSQLAPAAGRRLLQADVPAPVHRVLQNNGLLDDPNYAMNSLRARWVEECYWIYRRTFDAPAEAVSGTSHLVFDRIEMIGRILLNGEEVGTSNNALYPVRIDVTGKLKERGNVLVAVIESGMFSYSDHYGQFNPAAPDTAWMTKRNWLRKAQNQSGWDWHPRLQNVGILGDVRLEYSADVLAGLVSLSALLSDDMKFLKVKVSADAWNCTDGKKNAALEVVVKENGASASKSFTIPAGKTVCDVELEFDDPRLWWPRGCGEQFLYTAEIKFAGSVFTRKFGARKIEVDQSEHPVEGSYFIIKVNDRPVFCKGGNLVPADIYYSEVDGRRYEELVDIAVEANFNLLRIWGGGIYMTQEFCSACDRAGILIWHDFIFACAKYPGESPDFVKNVCAEAEYIVRKLNNHPSMAVWCGNNELDIANYCWYPESRTGWNDHAIFHYYLKVIVNQNAPQIFYWASSPSSPDCKFPQDPTCGDQHPWKIALETQGGTDFWEHRKLIDRFPNEGGILGASTIPTLKAFLPENEQFVRSFSWDHHDNAFARRDTVFEGLGHCYTTIDLWVGKNALEMPLEKYAVISGLLQAEGLEEYIYNYRRRMFSSASAIFWMFNDSWPVTNGWTIIDYYLRRKLSFHPVRRAFADQAVVAVTDGNDVIIYGVNDSDTAWQGILRYGVFNVNGGFTKDDQLKVTLNANSSTVIARFPKSIWDAAGTRKSGVFAILYNPDGSEAAYHRLFVERFKDMEIVKDPEVMVILNSGKLTLLSDKFVWKCCLDVNGRTDIADNAFDLFPGIPKIIDWQGDAPTVQATGNSYIG